MDKLYTLTDSFRTRFDSFMIGCDSQEEINSWNKEENGEMDAFYMNEFISTILRLIAADKVINEEEVEYLNQYFGFDYSRTELQDIYENCREVLSEAFSDRLIDDFQRLQKVNKEMAEEFKELLILTCDVIAESDGCVSDEEKRELELIKLTFN